MTTTPRTDHLIDQLINGKLPLAIDQGSHSTAGILWSKVSVRELVEHLLVHARQLETELTTWRTQPPRENYNLADCHKALQWHFRQMNSTHEHIGQILARMEQLRAGEAAASDGVTGD